MIDSNLLEKRFGIDVILQNLSPEEKYLVVNKHILNDSSTEKIKHIKDSIFQDSKSLLKFVSDILNIDIDLCNENLPLVINELLKAFYDYVLINPYFDCYNFETWCDQSDMLFIGCKNILEKHSAVLNNVAVLNEASLVSDERIRENIYNDLDDNSILLLYGLLTNNYANGYNPDMRNTVFNDIRNNRENSRIGSIILHSLKENDCSSLGSILGDYDMDICKNAQSNGTVLFDELGTIKSISKVGDNKYCVNVLNESNQPTVEDFFNELSTNENVVNMAKFYSTSVDDVLSKLKSKLVVNKNNGGDIVKMEIDFTDAPSGETIKQIKNF